MVADTVIIVCEPDPGKALTVSPLLRFLDDRGIPHMVFVNKMDGGQGSVKEMLDALQAVSERPLVLREIPIRNGDAVAGHVDLVRERAFAWEPGKPSKLIELPADVAPREQEARTELLEALADFDDGLLESLLEDTIPPSNEIYANLTKNLRSAKIVPVFFGSASNDNGVRRLLKALRHETPEPALTAERLGIGAGSGTVVQVFKSLNTSQTGKLSLARVWSGAVEDGVSLSDNRVSGLFKMLGSKQEKVAVASVGAVVGLGRLDDVPCGAVLAASGKAPAVEWPQPLSPLYARAIHAEKQSDEVKLTGALARLAEEDPSFSFDHNPDTNELVIRGQGDVHLQIVLSRLRNLYNLVVLASLPQVALT